jgi:membrane-associated phospholipid phosphatase
MMDHLADAAVPGVTAPRIGTWGLPDRRRVVVYFSLLIPLDILFVTVYTGCNWLTSLRDDHLHLYLEHELAIPFVPAMVVPYLSIGVLFVLPLFMLGESAMKVLAKRVAVATVLSGVIFLLLPAELGFQRPERVPGFQPAFDAIYFLDKPHNLVPSLHIIYSFLILNALMSASGPRFRVLFGTWLGVITFAVLLVHQHHVADVLGGLLVGWLCLRTVRVEKGTAS